MRTLRSVFDLFPQSRDAGLTGEQVTQSRDKFGQNRLTPLPREPIWKKFLEKFDEPIIQILLAASLLKIVVDLFTASPMVGGIALASVAVLVLAAFLLKFSEWVPSLLFALAGALFGVTVSMGEPSIEGLAVMVAVALATGVSFLSEYRSDREFEKLNATKDAIRVKVLRGGDLHTLALDEVVVGDLVLLETGDEVPADGRMVKATELMIDQSLMTGESEPVRKSVQPDESESDGPDQPGCLYRGTQVVDGLGEMIVTNVGDDTMIGQIARRLSGDEPAPESSGDATERVQQKLTISKASTPLQEKLADLAGLISKVGYIAAILIFLALLARGMLITTPPEVFVPANGADALKVAQNLLSYFVYMVIIIVVAVPEGLPMSVTVSLALAMRKMTRANALVRQLVATETIGSATVICSDKTGTLTQNKMRVVRLGIGGETFEPTSPQAKLGTPNAASASLSGVEWLALNGAVNSTATLEQKEGKTIVVGNSTEGALLHWLRDSGTDAGPFRLAFPVVYRQLFSSERKTMTTITRVGGKLVALVKGAPEMVLERCTQQLEADGSVRDFTSRDRVREQLSAASGEAMRTLAFAQVELPANFPTDEDAIHARLGELDGNLIFTGFVAIRDPLRDDVKDAIARCREAGIDVKMITGDNAETARAIARDAGLLDSEDCLVLTSAEFNKFTDEEITERLPRLRVLARAKPLDKYRMVRLLQAQRHVVAMTGDGTNDAPSLKAADVGLAMGIAGTEVAKEASKIVLLDDAFSTIVKAVHWGRSLYENIQRFIQFQLTINVSALVIAFLGPFFGLKPPFTVLQLLWINVIMDTFAAIALCSEPPRPGLMRRPPKRRDESILTKAILGNIFITATFFIIVMLALLKGMETQGWFKTDDVRSTEFPELTVRQVAIFFTVYVFFQVWNQINCRSLTPSESGLWGLWKNPFFLLIASMTLIGQIVIVTFGGKVFSVEPLGLMDWLIIGAATSSVLIFSEVARLIRKAM